MKYVVNLLCLVLLTIVETGCSRDPTDITNTKWECNKNRKCSISFIAENKSHLPVESIIRIRAHRRRYMGDAVQNYVVGDKVLHTTLDPGEKHQYSETLESNSFVTNIVVTITSREK